MPGVLESDRTIYSSLGDLLAYPDGCLVERVQCAIGALQEDHSQAAVALVAFKNSIAGLSLGALQELHTRTFDVAPQCIPYVSVHIFGEESFKRSELMSGLVETYRRDNFSWEPELPDHLAVVLRFASHFTEEEWREMVNLCLKEPLQKMIQGLEKSSNPYQFILKSIDVVLDREAGGGND